ncbi:MAG: pyrroloquinoline quinone biosynthesis protein PqqB [Limisphaerales bacterium]
MLGAAAGGGLPQWNCGCANCRAARNGQIEPRTQSSVAIGDDRGRWFLVNASPDLPAQIRSFPELQPHAGALRGTPIAGVLLTNADLDHVLGLFLLREGGRLHIYATNTVRQTLDRSMGLTPLLDAFCGVAWRLPSENDFAPLEGGEGKSSLLCRAIGLPGKPPLFAEGKHREGTHSVAYQFMDQRTGRRLLVAPDVAECHGALSAALQESDAVLFDGTFWSGNELSRVKPQARTAADMGHLTIKDDSLALLGGLRAPRKIYVHINNTNPVLCPGSPEQAAVAAAGIEVGYDGLEFEL